MEPASLAAPFIAAGWGLLLVFGQEAVAYALNTLGWRACIAPAHRTVPFRLLLRYRIIGDGLTYLIPSGVVAGEWTRTTLLGSGIPVQERLSSVVMAKFAQVAAMALTCSAGLLLMRFFGPDGDGVGSLAAAAGVGLAALILMLAAGAALLVTGMGARLGHRWPFIRDLHDAAQRLLKDRPWQFAGAVALFSAAYFWGAFEAYWICRLLGFPIDVLTAFKVSILSSICDAAIFYIPAKIGALESTRALVFTLIGKSAAQGLSFGLVQHSRELFWAAVSLILLGWDRASAAVKAPSGVG